MPKVDPEPSGIGPRPSSGRVPLTASPSPPLTPYKAFCEKWRKGCGADICSRALNRVFARGTSVPADVLFIGEAPGVSEDVLAAPFVGPAGKKMDAIIRDAFDAVPVPFTYCLFNLVGCIPRRGENWGQGGKAVSEPYSGEIEQCRPRLIEFIRLCRPRLIVNVGSLAKTWSPPPKAIWPLKHQKLTNGVPSVELIISIDHPAYILRLNYAQRGLATKRCVAQIVEALERLSEGDDHAV